PFPLLQPCPPHEKPLMPSVTPSNPFKKPAAARKQASSQMLRRLRVHWGAASRKLAQNALAADLDKFASNCEDTIADLATKHGKKEEYIRALLMSETHYPETRAPTLRNALIHQLSRRLTCSSEGITIHLHELQAIADVRLSTEEFSTDEVAALIATLNKHRNHKARGLRATNTASAIDARSVADKTQDEASLTPERTGTDAFGFFSLGALDDPSMPTFVSMGNAAAFCLQVLKMPTLDILRLYEQWVIKSNQGIAGLILRRRPSCFWQLNRCPKLCRQYATKSLS
ncbi:hypothetical protein B0H14DRAFT_2368135, partial [Mycena olivaceomarginata]